MIGTLKRLAKNALANPGVRRAYNGANRAVLEVAGSSRIGATLYSLPGFLTHNREQYAVLSGRRSYYRNLGRSRASHVELRRNVHRLEKGILMQPRRDVFARDYIEETVEFYAIALKRPSTVANLDAGEMQWAHDVLAEYFSIVTDDDPGVARSRRAFEALLSTPWCPRSRPACPRWCSAGPTSTARCSTCSVWRRGRAPRATSPDRRSAPGWGTWRPPRTRFARASRSTFRRCATVRSSSST